MTLEKTAETTIPADKTWQQTKSENTRSALLEATLDCFFELGYAKTTTNKVSKRAGVSRGAMLHHFPSKMALVGAAVAHLNVKRLMLFEEQALHLNQDAEHSLIHDGIDIYWQQLHSPLFTIFHELKVAARTDAELREMLNPATKEFVGAWIYVARRVFPDLALSEEFDTANFLTLFLLEGMAVNGATTGRVPERMISWLKAQLSHMFVDVSNVDRQSASSQTRKPLV